MEKRFKNICINTDLVQINNNYTYINMLDEQAKTFDELKKCKYEIFITFFDIYFIEYFIIDKKGIAIQTMFTVIYEN